MSTSKVNAESKNQLSFYIPAMDQQTTSDSSHAYDNAAYVSMNDGAIQNGLNPKNIEIKIEPNINGSDIKSKTSTPSPLSSATESSSHSSEKKTSARFSVFVVCSVLATIVLGAAIFVSIYFATSDPAQNANEAAQKTVVGELTISNWNYSPDLQDPASKEYKNLAYVFCTEIDAVYKRSRFAHLYAGCQVTQFRAGSVRVTYKIGFKTNSDEMVGKAVETLNNAVREEEGDAFTGWKIDISKVKFSVALLTAATSTPATPTLSVTTGHQEKNVTSTTGTTSFVTTGDTYSTVTKIVSTSTPTSAVKTTTASLLRSTAMTHSPVTTVNTSTPGTSSTAIPTTPYPCGAFQWACLDGSACVWESWLCDREDDCSDGSDEMQNCVCTDTEFRCDNGKCIRPSLKCDNRNQCGDYSDEAGCPCLVNQFRCQTTPLCVHEDHWCDGTPDCPDGSDELQNCTCLSSQGKCSSGQCIPGSKLCDRRLDCQDRSDETWCPCGSWEFRCENGLCYDKSRWCDGKDDCFDGSDEKPNCTCLREQTKCKTSGKCIMDYQICDGTEHCEDGSDEMNCNCSVTQFRCGTGQCIEVQKYCDGDPDCPDNSDEPGLKCGCLPSHFTCSSGLCVSRAVLCDGTDDCGDGSDESYTLTGCNSTFCNEFQFKCPNGGCISLAKVCDRRLDCHDGRDEMQNCECRSNEFLCPSSTNCIHMSYVCDGYEHCDDGADEMQNCVCPNTTHFQCGNGRCVLGSERCDRDDDCGDNTDELHCGCKPYQWECGDGRCIEKQWVCDGHQDCADGDDEITCNVCEAGQFSCGDNTTCVPARAQCDGMVNCPNGRDEKNCLRLDASNETMTGVAKAWHQNQWYPICLIDVNSRWFDRICKELGHGTVIHVNSVNVTSNLYMKLNTSIATPLVRGSLVPSTGCNGSKALSLSCGSKICGTKSPNLPEVEMAAPRVTGGEQATEGAWPWQASLMTLIGGHYCGATLINKQWLLTGAHCIDWLPSFLHRYLAVRLGSVKLVLPDAKSVVVRVKATYSHPQFETPSAINNDIALLKLEAPVTYTDYIRPVCLPSVDEPVSPKRRCYITGWGATQGNRATATMHLREAKAQEETDAVCDAATSLMTYVYNATTMMCALYESGIINACAGDSGGPMVCEDMTGRWVLHGVNSWGHIVCNKPTFPSVFTEVYHYRDWIDQVIKDNP